jgi:hypothetical protein
MAKAREMAALESNNRRREPLASIAQTARLNPA